MSSVELFTRAARNHAARLTRAIEPVAGRLEREFGKWLRAHRYDPAQRRALAGITPLAAARAGGLARFVEQVERHGRSLARWNLPPPEAHEALAEFGRLLAEALEGRFAPSREQIHLATVLALTRAYYQVREAETQALFAIYRADAECSDTLQFLRRLAGILTRGFGAQAGRLLALDQPPSGKLASPRSIAGGTGQESAAALIADPFMRGKVCQLLVFAACPVPRSATGLRRPTPLDATRTEPARSGLEARRRGSGPPPPGDGIAPGGGAGSAG